MYREIINKLADWKKREDKKPIILSGGFGTGKTTMAVQFAKKYYEKFIVFDIQNKDSGFSFFGDLVRRKFDEVMESYTTLNESKENIFLIFDNLEEKTGKNTAETIVKFLVEELRDYHICIITAHVPETILQNEVMEKVEKFCLYPISLKEFFIINGDEGLLEDVLKQMEHPLYEEQIKKLKQYLSVYFITGGMPSVVKCYMESRDLKQVDMARKSCLEVYLSKIAAIPDEKLRREVLAVYQSIGSQLDKKNKAFQYRKLYFLANEKKCEGAVNWLFARNMITPVKEFVNPQSSAVRDKKRGCRFYLTDVGMLSYQLQVSFADLLTAESALEVKNHALTEQFVLQQIQASELFSEYFFWNVQNVSVKEDRRKNMLEFVCKQGRDVVPVALNCFREKNQALSDFLDKYQPQFGVEVTEIAAGWEEKKIQIPIYAIWNL